MRTSASGARSRPSKTVSRVLTRPAASQALMSRCRSGKRWTWLVPRNPRRVRALAGAWQRLRGVWGAAEPGRGGAVGGRVEEVARPAGLGLVGRDRAAEGGAAAAAQRAQGGL